MNIPGRDEEPRRWRMTDRRQIAVHRGLRLFGEAPAAHFVDACRVMDGRDWQTTTHLVGLSLRELESGIRGVLVALLTPEQHEAIAAEEEMTHREQIEQICTLLGFDPDDPIGREWWKFAKELSDYTHRSGLRAPRPVDNDFLDWWQLAQDVLVRVVTQYETIYGEALPRIEELAAKEQPVRNDLTELRGRVSHGDVAMEHFFLNATPGWFPLLREADYFTNPAPLESDEDGRVMYIPWPPGTYLVRMARENISREEVVALARALDGTDNPGARDAIIDIALAVPADAAVPLAEQIAGFLTTPYQWRLPYKARELIAHFAAAGEIVAALAILRPLISPSPATTDHWRGAAMLEEIVPELFPDAGIAGLGVLADLLDEHLTDDPRTRERDQSYLWRPVLEGGRRHDLRDALVDALRDGATRVVADDATQLVAVVAFLEGRGGSIYARLALDLLRRHPDTALVSERLGDRARWQRSLIEHEWTLLAQQEFGALPPEVQQRVLGWIEDGPDVGEREGADAAEYRERWRRRELARLGDGLPDEWRARRDELIAQYGEAPTRTVGRAIWSGSQAPISKDELAAKSVGEIVDYLNDWTPEGEFDVPSPEGLSRVLAEVAAEDPARFAAAAESFLDVEPTYARHVLSGLAKAVWEERGFEWPEVLAFARAALERPRYLNGRPEQGDGQLDPGWIWARLEIARLLVASLSKNVIPAAYADEVWELIAALAEDPEPDVAYEDRWADGAMGPSGLALNTVRGEAFEALMRYVWWRHAQRAEGEEARLEERARLLLERHLDPDVEPTRTVRAVYGEWFPLLVAVDSDWAAHQRDRIFPLAGDDARLGRAAWDSYLQHNRVYDPALELLRPHYIAAIEHLAAGDLGEDDIRAQLIGHLIYLYVSDRAQLADDLLGRFLGAAPLAARAQLIETIGFDLMQEDLDVEPERLARLQQLGESRLQAARAADGDALAELRGFGWWFASARFDDEWSVTQLAELLEAGGRTEPDYVVLERLAALRDTQLPLVVRALAALIVGTEEPWFVLRSRDEVRAILADGLAGEDEDVRQTARQATNRLIARGHLDFGELLQ